MQPADLRHTGLARTGLCGHRGDGVTKKLGSRQTGHVRVALSRSACLFRRQSRMHGRQKQCSQASRPNLRSAGLGFLSTASMQIVHAFCIDVHMYQASLVIVQPP
jgi:hypothetical protein